jgi:hypothetical protein
MSRRKHLEALLSHLDERYSEVMSVVCSQLNYDLAQLQPKSLPDFASPGVSSEIQQLRWQHFEERRAAKVTAVANEVARSVRDQDDKLEKLLRFFGISRSPRQMSESSSTYEGLSHVQCKV